MSELSLVAEEMGRMKQAIERIRTGSLAKAVSLLDKNGETVASVGAAGHVDRNALAGLSLAVLGPTNWHRRYNEPHDFRGTLKVPPFDQVLVSVVAGRVVVKIVIAPEIPLTPVRLQCHRAVADFARLLKAIDVKVCGPRTPALVGRAPFPPITDEEMDALLDW